MIIAFDAKRAFHNRSGLGNYSRQLIETIRTSYPEWRMVLYSSGKRWDLIPDAWSHDPSIHMIHTKGSYFRSFGVVGDLDYRRARVYHGLSNELPFNINRFDGRKVVTVHDVIFRRRPGDYRAIDRTIYHIKTAKAVDNAHNIIAISEQTRGDLEKWYPASRGKISVIYQDADPSFRVPLPSADLDAFRKERQLPERFWLFVGASMPRKNLTTLLAAWESLPPGDRLPLVITGPEQTAYGKKVQKIIQGSGGAGSGLIWLGEVTQTEIRALYRMADMLLFPSLVEGFGLPVLESLYSGTPVLASRELGFEAWHGKGILPVSVDKVHELAEALRQTGGAGKAPPPEELEQVFGAQQNLDKLLRCYIPE